MQRLPKGSARSSGEDRRDCADVHQVDHRDRRVCFGERRRDGREATRPKTRSPALGRQGQSEQPGSRGWSGTVNLADLLRLRRQIGAGSRVG